MSYPTVDFRKPARVPEDIGQMLAQWQHGSREAIEVRMGRIVSSDLKVAEVPPQPVTGEDLRVADNGTLVYRVDMAKTSAATLFILDRQLAIAMAAEMLGATPDALPEDRTLTDIELTCLDFVLEEIKSVIVASQKLKPICNMNVVGRVELKELHSEFPAHAANSTFGYRFELPYGEGTLRWIIPQAVTLEMLAASPKTIQSNGQSQEDLKRLVLNAPSRMCVRLGESQVLLSTLRGLSPGDIIVLDQKIDEPLTGEVGGQPMFFGWCGKSGNQQVFQIEELIEQDTD